MKIKKNNYFLKQACILASIIYSIELTANLKVDSISNTESIGFLKFKCKITNNDIFENPIEATLYLDNEIVKYATTDKNNKFEFRLLMNSHYIIQISCPFYITRYVVLNTNILEKNKIGLKEEEISYLHTMEMELYKQPVLYHTSSLNSDILDEPITIIRYFEDSNTFDIDEKYTRRIKRELRLFQKNADKQTENQKKH